MAEQLTEEDLAVLELVAEYRDRNKLSFFQPYPRQLEFNAKTDLPRKNEFMFFAGNRLGKTEMGAYMMAAHLTGLYPKAWNGRKFQRPITAWACGDGTQTIREALQEKLLGPDYFATRTSAGMIPARCVLKVNTMRGATAETAETLAIQHYDAQGNPDGISHLTFKSFDQGREKFQARGLDLIWFDEEPRMDVYAEGLARLGERGGFSYMTFTPLRGWSDVVNRFLRDVDPESRRCWVRMGPKDAKHMTPELIKDMLSRYQRHEWAARLNGEPKLGSGAEFPYAESELTVPIDLYIPEQWTKLWGLDFGIAHPFAAVLTLWDKDRDVFYIWDCYRVADARPATQSQYILKKGGNIPVAWPHDGWVRDKGSGEELASFYRDAGLRMLDRHATFPTGGFSTEAAIKEMHDRMTTGRFKVRADLHEWWEEFRMYHRDENGQIVKAQDDLLSATMKALMMKRHGKQEPFGFGMWQVTRKRRMAYAQAAYGQSDAFQDAFNGVDI